MSSYFDQNAWTTALQQPEWYAILAPEYERLLNLVKESSPEVGRRIKDDVYQFLEDRLAQHEIILGQKGMNWDQERKSIDTVVIHHTGNPPGITWQRLSAMHLIRLYAPSYLKRWNESGRTIPAPRVYSHHFRNNEQVFYAYHWLVRDDGTSERLLDDTETGWQAGNWDVNCRSVAICFDNNLRDAEPAGQALEEAARIIRETYPQVHAQHIIGHHEVNKATTCPGAAFVNGWKRRLVERVGK